MAVVAVLVLMAPLPLVPFANILPAVAIILLCLGMAERDGALILLGHLVATLSTAYVGLLLWLAAKAGSDPKAAWEAFTAMARALLGG